MSRLPVQGPDRSTYNASVNDRSDQLEDFPTPPWATRALLHMLESVLHLHLKGKTVWEPACGRGFMSRPLGEAFETVIASDIHDYGGGGVHDFLGEYHGPRPDWIITNPPFGHGRLAAFTQQAMKLSREGCAIFGRVTMLEGIDRYRTMYQRPPLAFMPFVERVPLVKGRCLRSAGTTTAYAWCVWHHRWHLQYPVLIHIPPCRKALERAGDYDDD